MKKESDLNLEEQIKNRRKHDRANTVFLKLYSKIRSNKNPFDVTRSYTPPQTNDKPGEAINDTL